MPLEPMHPDELVLHHALRDALNQRLTSTDFFVWIRVSPRGDRGHFNDLDGIVSSTEAWLSQLDPDAVDASALPEETFSDQAADVEIQAIPKKPTARGQRPTEVVGNPEPALAGWLP